MLFVGGDALLLTAVTGSLALLLLLLFALHWCGSGSPLTVDVVDQAFGDADAATLGVITDALDFEALPSPFKAVEAYDCFLKEVPADGSHGKMRFRQQTS